MTKKEYKQKLKKLLFNFEKFNSEEKEFFKEDTGKLQEYYEYNSILYNSAVSKLNMLLQDMVADYNLTVTHKQKLSDFNELEKLYNNGAKLFIFPDLYWCDAKKKKKVTTKDLSISHEMYYREIIQKNIYKSDIVSDSRLFDLVEKYKIYFAIN